MVRLAVNAEVDRGSLSITGRLDVVVVFGKALAMNVSHAYRSGDLQISQALSDLCLPIASFHRTAVEKETWWYDNQLSLTTMPGTRHLFVL
jgi:hypothetical protein